MRRIVFREKEAILPLVFGLGNPGSRYAHSRHNVGFDALDSMTAFLHRKMRRRCLRLYKQCLMTAGDGAVSLLVQPLTFMNRSGEIVHHFIPNKYSVEDLLVICDNLDLPPGTIRIRKGGSSAGHNGLKSLIKHLGSADFIRIYVGIGRPQAPTTVIDHVLGVPEDPSESDALESGIRKAADAAIRLCNGQTVEEVSRVYNKRNGAG
ncbi:aminoacyl-tRNA hydrolase [Pleomorphochaeta sp. DL1XJH-081]|uniref:aminoacyl-tRNA hydrolase n=1 Tax=Pleomorphochaeta sp. DL1XJH-081 TaxID=3409690 RepID=UPI003BB68A86